ncbi:alpha-L-rhamnosidase N-terminal domain-containing protein [Nocardia sp. NPDC005745]|uniref:alpha-L-rhamnosidase N-terminal domain-containing protein n=1 Tax=Nocardia sp. NPDC005745 TaxID=3157061 RepID=UPI0033D05F6B
MTAGCLVPRFTPFDHYMEYQTYDVTDRFRVGDNIMGLAVGDGRYRGRLGFASRRNAYGNQLAALLQIELDLADGTTRTVVTDEGWAAGPGRIIGSDPKHGERVDLRIPDSDWLSAAQRPGRFGAAQLLTGHPRRLVAEEVPRVGEISRWPATRVWRAPSGRHRLVELIEQADHRLDTGFLSTPMLLQVLTDNGHTNVGFR